MLENNVLNLDPVMLEYDNTPDGQLFIQTNIDAEKVMAGEDVYNCENLTNYPLTPGTKTWASTVTFAGPYNHEPIQGVAANSTIRNVQSACLAKAVELGAQIVFDSPAKVLVQDAEGNVTGVIAKQNGKYVQFWQWADLSSLGKVTSLSFSFSGTKANDYGLTTPTYICIDDLTYKN